MAIQIRTSLAEPDTGQSFVPHRPERPPKAEGGRAFTVAQWEQYLKRLRGHALALGVSARTIEYTLFHCHRKLQRGRLYD